MCTVRVSIIDTHIPRFLRQCMKYNTLIIILGTVMIAIMAKMAKPMAKDSVELKPVQGNKAFHAHEVCTQCIL